MFKLNSYWEDILTFTLNLISKFFYPVQFLTYMELQLDFMKASKDIFEISLKICTSRTCNFDMSVL